jgi:hypothetical protein
MLAAGCGHSTLTSDAPGTAGSDAPLVLLDLLATNWPELRARLLAEHTHDGHGHCQGCRVPGYGTPGADWPCLLAAVALRAERLAAEKIGG